MSLIAQVQRDTDARLQRAAEQREAPKRPATHRCRSCGRHLGPDDVTQLDVEYQYGDVCPCGAFENFEKL